MLIGKLIIGSGAALVYNWWRDSNRKAGRESRAQVVIASIALAAGSWLLFVVVP